MDPCICSRVPRYFDAATCGLHSFCNSTYSSVREFVNSEHDCRNDCDDHCRSLMSELACREGQLEKVKSDLLSRVSGAEVQLKKLVQLRSEETMKAIRATSKLRVAVTTLQRRYEGEKQELENSLQSVREATKEEIDNLNTMLRQGELLREQLQSKLKASDSNIEQLNAEIAQLKSEAVQSAARLSQLLETNRDLSDKLNKLRSAHHKVSGRAETAARQIGELRKQLDQANLAVVQAERRMHAANERRIAAESALSAVRQRADVQTQRSCQLEREAATEKARLDEKCQLHEAEIQKIQRRLLALQAEAANWKRVYQAEKTAGDERVNRANQLLQNALDERTKLEVDLKASLSREADCAKLIDQLQHQATVDATDASSRLYVALSTGEEGVLTALELKRCIEEQLQPELEDTKQLYREALAESEEWREKHDKLNTDLDECRGMVKILENRLSECQAVADKEIASLRLNLNRAECDAQLKSALLAKSTEQSEKYESDISRLRATLDQFRSATDEQLSRLDSRIAKLRSAHKSTSANLHSAQTLCAHLKSVRDAAQAELTTAQAQLREARSAHESVRRSNLEELNTIKLEMTSMEGKLARTEAELQKLRNDSARQLLTNSEEYEHVISQLKKQLTTELHNLERMQHRVSELCTQLAESESKFRSVDADRSSLRLHCNELEDRLQELEKQLSLRDHELRMYQEEALKPLRPSNSRASNSQLEQRKHAQVEQFTQCCSNDACSSEDLLKQLYETRVQRDRAFEDLAETKHHLEAELTAKQALMDRIKVIQDDSSKIQASLQNELNDSRRDCDLLQQRVDHYCVELQKAESRIRETENRVASAEAQQKKAVREAEQLALDLATERAVSEASESAFSHFTTQGMGSLLPCLENGVVLQLPSGSDGREQSQHQRPPALSGRRRVTFAPSPPKTDSVAPRARSAAARDLEALIREVTINLDTENSQE